MSWSPQQEQALAAVKDWIKDEGNQVFRLFGYAGTGKTTLAKEIAESSEGEVMFGAFTGKAASVMRRKGCRGARTIHSMIYKLKNQVDGKPEFELDLESDVKEADLLIIDECSMLGEDIGKDLLSFGTKILVLGDPAQLPPIKGTGFFTDAKPDFMLTEVHRQARDNPIIAMSMLIRERQSLQHGSYGDSRVIAKADITSGEILAADQVIVGLNRTRQLYNGRIRQLLNRQPETPVAGDKLICLRNDRHVGVFNGSMWTATKIKHKKRKQLFKMHIVSADDERDSESIVDAREEFFNGTEGTLPWQTKKGTQEFTFGYAITCHKSQGSQWGNTVVFDESGCFRDDAARWKYTAITRAADRVTVVM
jgi:ATP-dependent exoDNAse (exonuclease V) alpha subunit